MWEPVCWHNSCPLIWRMPVSSFNPQPPHKCKYSALLFIYFLVCLAVLTETQGSSALRDVCGKAPEPGWEKSDAAHIIFIAVVSWQCIYLSAVFKPLHPSHMRFAALWILNGTTWAQPQTPNFFPFIALTWTVLNGQKLLNSTFFFINYTWKGDVKQKIILMATTGCLCRSWTGSESITHLHSGHSKLLSHCVCSKYWLIIRVGKCYSGG